ncbi:hypothetical protein [Yoonia sp.]|uniref:hypothetical protein n=1 Tax=Yoonia sp. TaxID=2212373 RepID=UPI003F6C5E2B
MSDRVRTDEIDDMLSSVRKLVSHSEKIPLRARSLDDESSALEKFVLTAALRVTTDDPASPAEPDEQPVGHEPENVLLLDPAKRTDRAGLEATIAELEAAVIAQPDDWEPDEGEAFDEAAWAASAFHLHIVSDTPEDTETKTSEDHQTRLGPDLHDADQLASPIDPVALRAMVVEILRDELSGEIGERITRNVRKLVRREINRVLISRDLE